MSVFTYAAIIAEAEQMRVREALIEARLAKGWITSSQGGRHE